MAARVLWEDLIPVRVWVPRYKFMTKLASIIVPAYNEEKVIRKTLISLKNQTYRPIEIIVVYRGNDKTREISKKYTNEVFFLGEKGASKARNFGARHAKGEYLFFVDADTRLNQNAVAKAIKFLNKGYIGGTAKIEYDSKSYKIKAIEAIQNFCLSYWKICLSQFIYTTRKIFDKSNGWTETIEFGEDMNFLKKLSKFGKLKYISDPVIKTSARRFIKNKDYLYATLGGFLVMGGIKNLPFYAIRPQELSKKKYLSILEMDRIKTLLKKEISFSPKDLQFLLDVVNKNRFKKIFKNYKKLYAGLVDRLNVTLPR